MSDKTDAIQTIDAKLHQMGLPTYTELLDALRDTIHQNNGTIDLSEQRIAEIVSFANT